MVVPAELMMRIGHQGKILKLTFLALPLRYGILASDLYSAFCYTIKSVLSGVHSIEMRFS